ncbi:MAG TPA: hypothetical protein VKE69_13395 [Planctomycetota bacterium]|nr:hypothetical protein [Planctomycetota bacterium]
MRRPLSALVLAAALASPALATDKTYQNDTVVAGGPANVQAGFVKNEIAAAVFSVPPADGKVFLRNASVVMGNALGLSTTRQMRVLVYASGGVNPGTPIFTSPIFTFSPGALNIVDVSAQNIELAAGSTFTIGAKFEQDGGLSGLTSVVTDTSGIQSGKNLVFAVPGGWSTAESLGISGDFAIRADVTTNGPTNYGAGTVGSNGVPTIGSFGLWSVGSASFAIEGTNGPSSSAAFIAVSPAPMNLPIVGITLLVDAALAFGFVSPTDGAGAWSLPLPIPDSPVFADIHLYAQSLFLDGAAPQGLSATDGLDILVSP